MKVGKLFVKFADCDGGIRDEEGTVRVHIQSVNQSINQSFIDERVKQATKSIHK